MLSGRLIHLIESHFDEIAARVLADIRRDPELKQLHHLPDIELREWGQTILMNLGHWLAAGHDREVAAHYERLGQVRYEQEVPLHESVRALAILKEKILAFVEDQVMTKSAVELYAEEELEHRVGRFFDLLVFHLVRGYEGALRKAAHALV